jgi:hypothetical protein
MNEVIDLEKVWSSVLYENGTEFSYRAISCNSKPSINVGVDRELKRCLILELPNDYELSVPINERENLTLKYYENSNVLALILDDIIYKELFIELALSLYNKIKDLSGTHEYIRVFIATYHKWSEFFSPKHFEQLTKEQVKGIFGELLVLKDALIDSTPSDVNEVLASWKGPYDFNHDFVSSDFNVEVKTKDYENNIINIASEHQLDIGAANDLKLYVVSVCDDLQNGVSLSMLISSIRDIIYSNYGDSSILLMALRKKSLMPMTWFDYDNIRFMPKCIDIYDCLNDGFPKIVRSSMDKNVVSVKYKINLLSLGKFLLSRKLF